MATREIEITGDRHKLGPARHWWVRGFRFFREWPVIPLLILALLVVCGAFAPWVAPKSPYAAVLDERNTAPVWAKEGSSKYILGSDQQGRDLLSRIIFGARISLILAGLVISMSATIGTTLGLISGWFGGIVDEVIMRVVEAKLSIPLILITLVFVIVLGQSFALLVGLMAFWSWGGFARLVRAETLRLKVTDYVSLAKVAGAPWPRILVKHIFPGVTNSVLVLASLQVGGVILTEAILSFLGAGIPPPTPAWGSMIAEGRNFMTTAWWIVFFPGMAIVLTVLGFNFMGDWLRDRLDPRLRQL
ncbi:MAG: ABC transporter permease [Chloroflexota bacterium]|nr:ABC transporter permease [Chloroflexota bacterium]